MTTDSHASLLPTSCRLCPRNCGVDRAKGECGACGADDRLLVARAALHFWEEPPISGDSGSGTVFFAHCPLHCLYCQNSVIAQGDAGASVSIDDVSQMCLRLQDEGALNINFVTPTHYTPLIIEAVRRARGAGLRLPIVWNTGGYENVDTIRSLSGIVDVYLTDYKYADSLLAARYSRAADYPEVALAALREMVAQTGAPKFGEHQGQLRLEKGVVVRHLLLPDSLENSKRTAETLVEEFGDSILLSLMNQYTPVVVSAAEAGNASAMRTLQTCPELAHSVPSAVYEEFLDYVDDLGVDTYFWQEGEACKESFIPAFDLTGVSQAPASRSCGAKNASA